MRSGLQMKGTPGRRSWAVGVMLAGGFALAATPAANGQFQQPVNESNTWIGVAGGEWHGPGSWFNGSTDPTLASTPVNDATDPLNSQPLFTSYRPFPPPGPQATADTPSVVDQPFAGQGRQQIHGLFYGFDQTPNSGPQSSSFKIMGNPLFIGQGGIQNNGGSSQTIVTDILLYDDMRINGGSLMRLGNQQDRSITIDTSRRGTQNLILSGRTLIRGDITGDGSVRVSFGDTFLYEDSTYTGPTVIQGGQAILGESDSLGRNQTIIVREGSALLPPLPPGQQLPPLPNIISPLNGDLAITYDFDLEGDIGFGGPHDQLPAGRGEGYNLTVNGEFQLIDQDRAIRSETGSNVTINGPINMQSNQLTLFTDAQSSLRVDGPISAGAAARGLVKDGVGELVLAGNNIAQDGDIRLVDGTLTFAHRNAIAGSDKLTIVTESTLGAAAPFNANNPYTTDIDVNALDSVQFSEDSAPLVFQGNWVIGQQRNTPGARRFGVRPNENPVTFTDASSISLRAPLAIVGDGRLVIDGPLRDPGTVDFLLMNMVEGTGQGELVLGGDNSPFSAPIILDGGTLRLDNDNALGSGNTLEVQAPSGIAAMTTARSVTRDIELTGDLRLADGEALTLAGDVTANAPVAITSQNTSPTQIRGPVDLNTFDVTFGGTQDYSIVGPITSAAAASFIKDGPNTITLMGQSLNFGGTIEVNAGQLDVLEGVRVGGRAVVDQGRLNLEGRINDNAIVENGGLLFGGGAIAGDLTVREGGNINPGSGIGSLVVQGRDVDAVRLQSDSQYTVEFNAGRGTSDTIVAQRGGGRISPNVTFRLLQRDASEVQVGDSLTILRTIDGVRVTSPSTLEAEYVDSPLFLEFVPDPDFRQGQANFALVAARVPFEREARGSNAEEVASGLDALSTGNLAGADRDLITALNGLGNFDQFNAALDQLSPRQYTAMPTATVDQVQNFHRGLTDHLQRARLREGSEQNPFEALSRGGRRGPQLVQADDTRMMQYIDEQLADMDEEPSEFTAEWSLFVQGIGTRDNYDAAGGRPEYTADTYGVQIGADRNLDDHTILGIAGGYSTTDLDFGRGGDGSIDNFRIGPYLSYADENYFIDSAVSYGYHDNEINRTIRFPGFNQQATGTFDAHDLSAHVTAGFTTSITPIAGLDYTFYRRGEFDESGGNGANLGGDSETSNSLEATLGVRWADTFNLGQLRLSPNAFVGYSYEFLNDENDVDAAFSGANNNFNYTAEGDDGGSFRFGVGVSGKFTDQISSYVQYDGRTNSESDSHALIAGLTFRF